MEVSCQEFRVMIFYDFKKGLTGEESLTSLTTAFGVEAPLRATVFHWFAEFKHRRCSFQDEPCSGCPNSAVTKDTVAAVRNLLDDDRRVTYKCIQR